MYSKITKAFAVTSAVLVVSVVAAFLLLPDPAPIDTHSYETRTSNAVERSVKSVTDVVAIETAGATPPENPPSSSRGSDLEVMQGLAQIQDMLKTLDKRIVSIEDELDLARLENDDQQDLIESEDESDDEYSANRIAKQEKLKQFFYSLDQAFSENIDEQATTQKQTFFDGMISSQAKWQNEASLQSVNCGLDRCKVIVRFNEGMDTMAKFELDGMLLLSQADLPKSVVRNISNGDGTTDMVVYFAKKESELPVLE